jgi:cytoskeletal protein CcmA (bactofilin family)
MEARDMFRKDSPVADTTFAATHGSSTETVIGDGTRISGEITVDGDLRVDGEVDGRITATRRIVVGKTGVVKADVEAGTAEIAGRVVGKLHAQDRVVLVGGSRLEGDVQAQSFKIEDGAYFQGNCVMGGGRAQKNGRISESDETPRVQLAEKHASSN